MYRPGSPVRLYVFPHLHWVFLRLVSLQFTLTVPPLVVCTSFYCPSFSKHCYPSSLSTWILQSHQNSAPLLTGPSGLPPPRGVLLPIVNPGLLCLVKHLWILYALSVHLDVCSLPLRLRTLPNLLPPVQRTTTPVTIRRRKTVIPQTVLPLRLPNLIRPRQVPNILLLTVPSSTTSCPEVPSFKRLLVLLVKTLISEMLPISFQAVPHQLCKLFPS